MEKDATRPLTLYEEVMLLALHDQTGSPVASGHMQLVGTAMLCELVELERIRIGDAPKFLVEVTSNKLVGDPVLDELLMKIIRQQKPQWLITWISKAAANRTILHHRICASLCQRGVLKKVERKILWVFRQSAYPETRSGHKDEIRGRMEDIMFDNKTKPDPRTAALISIVNNGWLMEKNFPGPELKRHKKRLKKIREQAAESSTMFQTCRAAATSAHMMWG